MFFNYGSPKHRLETQNTGEFLARAAFTIILYGWVFISFIQVGTAIVQSIINETDFQWKGNIGAVVILAIYFLGRYVYSSNENQATIHDVVYLQDLIEQQAAEIAELKQIILAKEGDNNGGQESEGVEPEQLQEKPRG